MECFERLPVETCQLVYSFFIEMLICEEIERTHTVFNEMKRLRDRYVEEYHAQRKTLYSDLHNVLSEYSHDLFVEAGGNNHAEYKSLLMNYRDCTSRIRRYASTGHLKKCEVLFEQFETLQDNQEKLNYVIAPAALTRLQGEFTHRCQQYRLAYTAVYPTVCSHRLLYKFIVKYLVQHVLHSWSYWWSSTTSRVIRKSPSLPCYLNHYERNREAIEAFLKS